MKITSRNIFTFSNERQDEGREERYKKALNSIRSPVFKKLMESLGGKNPEQDYDRFLGLIDLISAHISKVPKQKKLFDEILSVDYLKGMELEDARDKVHKDLFTIYNAITAGKG